MPVFGWWSFLPPLVAIGLALWTRQIVVSLLAGIFIGWWIVAGGDPLAGAMGTAKCLVDVFSDSSQASVLLFTLLVGSLLMLIQRSGGVEGFVAWVARWPWSSSRRGAQLMAWFVGLGVFVESNITSLVVGTVSRPLFDRLKISREKLAYICDSTSAPVCIMLPINGWGAMVLGLLAVQESSGNLGGWGPVTVFLAAIPLNFYAIVAVLLVLAVILTGRDFGPMQKAERRAEQEGKLLRDGAMPLVDTAVVQAPPVPGAGPRLRNMLIPLFVMVAGVPAGIVVTGLRGLAEADIEPALGTLNGWTALLDHASGSTSVFWGVCLGLLAAALLIWGQKLMNLDRIVQESMRGAGGLIPMAVIMLLAFAIGMTCDHLGTGPWVAATVEPHLTPALIAPVVFLVSGLMAFSTGTSWGTFAIMIPLALPLATAFNADVEAVSVPLIVAAVLGGGVFGDHCSPISDTTVISSMAACSDHIDHVRTQIPYALIGGGVAAVLYFLAGMF